jgi:hypothetical protein
MGHEQTARMAAGTVLKRRRSENYHSGNRQDEQRTREQIVRKLRKATGRTGDVLTATILNTCSPISCTACHLFLISCAVIHYP